MTFIEIIDTFTFYGVDVALLAMLTAAATQLLKMTLFKNAKKKLVTFLPFMIGTLFYAVYAAVRNLSFFYIFEEYTAVLEHGISVGAAATLYYVLYEQFVREKSSLSATEKVISTLISGYVPADSLEKAAKTIAEALERDVTGDGASRAEEIIANFSNGDITENDIKLLSKLIIETMANLTRYIRLTPKDLPHCGKSLYFY